MAVDRSKFRTCSQTSFCRRHRENHSSRLYQYRLDLQSIHFHVMEKNSSEADKASLWKSLSKRILGHGGGDDADPYVQGPPPTLTGLLHNTAPETSTGKEETLHWSVHAMADGLVRMRITETGMPARVTYDELILTSDAMAPAEHALWIRPEEHPGVLSQVVAQDQVSNHMALQYGDANDQHGMLLLIRLDPFAVYLYRESDLNAGPIVSMGVADMMHFEVRRPKDGEAAKEEEEVAPEEEEQTEEKPEKEIVGYWEDGLAIYADGTREERKEVKEEEHRHLTESELDRDGLWEESFGSHHDSKPYGPMSVGMDISFPRSSHVFGLPEHASSLELKATLGEGAHYSDPYRLYNLDVFEYELDETMALYGYVPLVVSQSVATGTCGVFWFNPTETFVDVMSDGSDNGKTTHWISESGIIDTFLLPGPTPADMYRQYAILTGTAPVPPMFSLGYHQCRWNYKDERDVYQVHSKFEELDYPYDVLWLDIEHTDGKRYFTWDENLFPHPVEMQQKLASQGRRMVTIIDPHIKRDDGYPIHKEATSKGLYIKDKDGKKDYDGWCWPGSSSYLDFTNSKVRSWWADQFAYNKYQGSTSTLFTWNDMNEPSVFNGPEVTMQKDLRNLDGVEQREWHNLYGILFQRATGEGQIRRNHPDEDVRPFVLTRSFFAGSQRYGAIWTGDNAAEWSHLEIASPMLLSLNVAALSFVGADVGGFFGNTDAELMTRWMQAGAYQPFFRGHAHHDSNRREPWLFGDETMVRLRRAAMARYALLPFWYTVFREAEATGMPVMRTMWMQYPRVESLFATEDQYMIGSCLLVKPVTAPNVVQSTVQFPIVDTWYDVDTMKVISASGKGEKAVATITVKSDIDKIPVYQRGGSVIPRKLRLRRSAMLMKNDPYTLYVALDKDEMASGNLYMDDEESFGYERRGEFAEASFSADLKNGSISNTVHVGPGWVPIVDGLKSHRMVERIVIMGVKKSPKTIAGGEGGTIDFEYDSTSKVLVLRKPLVSALEPWQITIG